MSAWLRWCLSPVLTALGVLAIALGLGHLVSCQHFYFFAPGVINGVLLLVVGFHGLFLKFPARSQCLLQCIAILIGIVLSILCALELFCIPTAEAPAPLGSVCFGLNYRFGSLTKHCRENMGDLRDPLIKLVSEERFFLTIVSGGLIIVSLLQVLATSAAAWYTALETRIHVRVHHAQLPLSLAVIALGVVHTLYCGTYFYVGFGIWAGALMLIQATITWRTDSKGMLARALNIIGSGLGMALAAVNGFGLFCWFSALSDDPVAFKRHCEWRSDSYARCVRRVSYTNPYFDWPPEHREAEMRNLQFVAYSGLCVAGLLQFAISLRSTFRKISL